MRRSFNFHDLHWEEFEQLVSTICMKILGTGVVVFATGKDGGRDGTFAGTAESFPSRTAPYSGRFVIQAKHTANPTASCADAEFEKLCRDESPRVSALCATGELDHYLLFTNRKKPATSSIKKERSFNKNGCKTASIVGIEQLRNYLTIKPQIWSSLGFDRFDKPFAIGTDDLTEVIRAFHRELDTDGVLSPSGQDFTYVQKPKKNRINKLSKECALEIETRSVPHFSAIQEFLHNPRNDELRALYEDTASEIRQKLLVSRALFGSFDHVLSHLVELVVGNNPQLKFKKRFAAIFLHYMYYTCDIGQHDNSVKTA
jgi:hypothetical protein